MHAVNNTLIVTNRDRHGQRLRPSDWHHRLASLGADFKRGRLVYDRRIQPCKQCVDRICVVVDRSLAEDKKHVIDAVESFMRVNQLQPYDGICPKAQHKRTHTVVNKTSLIAAA